MTSGIKSNIIIENGKCEESNIPLEGESKIESKKSKKRNRKNKPKTITESESKDELKNEIKEELIENVENDNKTIHGEQVELKKNVKKTGGAEKKIDPKSKSSKKGAAMSAFAKRLAEAKQEVEQKKREQEEIEKEIERKEKEEQDRKIREQQIKEEKKAKEKERKKRLREEGKILTKSQKDRQAKDKQGLQRLLQGGATCVALNPEPRPRVTHKTLQSEIQHIDEFKQESISPVHHSTISSLSPDSIKSLEIKEAKRPHIADPIIRIQTRTKENKAEASKNKLRSPIICVMGHVDTGKTKILDKLRNTNVQDGEAGGITQQIGVTNVPLSAVQKSVSICPKMKDFQYKIKGIAIIDTPGHFSFQNLRSLGSSLCDMAILIVDIMHSIEPQTKESIKLLLANKAPFVVALNKIDLLIEWESHPDKSIEETLKLQSDRTKLHFQELFRNTFTKFSELGLNLAMFNENTNPQMFISAIPTSARTGDGIGDLIAYICEFSQNSMAHKLAVTKELEASVMEVRSNPGLGTSIDVILVNGTLKVGDRIIVPGHPEPIVTQIRALLTPQPMKEMRVKGSYIHHNSISVSQGIKISAPNLEDAIAGFPIFVAEEEDEIEYYKKEMSALVTKTMSKFEKKDKGVYVVASTLGSLEALLSYLSDSKIPFFGFNIGPVHKKDVSTAAIMLEHNPLYAAILAFDVKIDPDAKELADSLKVRIFSAEIIYHLHDNYTQYVKEYNERMSKQFRSQAVFPCVLRILPDNVFKTRDPIIVGVCVEDGTARIGTTLCVPTKDNVVIGIIAGMEINHKQVDIAKKGQEVCIKITSNDHAPRLLGRHFEVTDLLVSKITRESIDIMKQYFRTELSKKDWLLIKNLKTTFQIL